MDGLFFLMAVVGIGLVMFWVVQNDRAAPDRPTRGLFAMPAGGRARSKGKARRGIDGRQPPAAAAAPPPEAAPRPVPWPRS